MKESFVRFKITEVTVFKADFLKNQLKMSSSEFKAYNLPQFVLVANNHLRELGFVNRGCF